MQRGSPIRTPSDHRPFTNSPRLIAGHHVLHRLLIPRHPPCALTHSPHLTTCSKPDNTQQQTITTIIHQMLASTIHKQKQQQEKQHTVSVPPQPNNVPTRMPHAPSKEHTTHAHNTPQQCTVRVFVTFHPKISTTQTRVAYPPNNGWLLLRKEVIQPHLPVRLPCYDLVPITSPTFDGSPHTG